MKLIFLNFLRSKFIAKRHSPPRLFGASVQKHVVGVYCEDDDWVVWEAGDGRFKFSEIICSHDNWPPFVR